MLYTPSRPLPYVLRTPTPSSRPPLPPSSTLHVPRGTVDYCHWLSLTQVRAANISPPHRYKVHVCRCQSVFAATNLHIATTDNDIHNYSLLLQPQKREAVCFASVKSTLQRQNYYFTFLLLLFFCGEINFAVTKPPHIFFASVPLQMFCSGVQNERRRCRSRQR